MAKAGPEPKPAEDLKSAKVETRVPPHVKVELQGMAHGEGLDLSKWVRNRLTRIANARGYTGLSPLDIHDLNRAAVLVHAGQKEHAVGLITGVIKRHELSQGWTHGRPRVVA